ncbi:hypothetical protein BRD00_15040 [Halobacteriales archaeon QS_8_69_26]|nr:MAG: hypothetical protein BRD00_15040 [Halobacteriales archaeon QS_8_69_26]
MRGDARRLLVVAVVLAVALSFAGGAGLVSGSTANDNATAAAQPDEVYQGCGQGTGQDDYNETINITEPGTYKLAEDFEVVKNVGTCISIEASDVTLKGNGATLGFDNLLDKDNQIGIAVGNDSREIENVVVQSLSVKGSLVQGVVWDKGIMVRPGASGVDDLTIRDVTVQMIEEEGIIFDGVTDGRIVDSDVNTIAIDTTADGITLKNGWDNTISNTDVYDVTNSGVGISVADNDTVIEDSSVRNTAGRGIDVAGSANDTTVRDTTVKNAGSDGSSDGIFFQADDVSVVGVNSSENGGQGVDIEGKNGTVLDSNFYDNGHNGIDIAGDDATVRNVSVVRSRSADSVVVAGKDATVVSATVTDGVNKGIDIEASNATVRDTVVSGHSSNYGVDVRSDKATLRNVTVSNNDDGVRLTGAPDSLVANSTIKNNNANNLYAQLEAVDAPRTTVRNTTVRANSDHGIYFPSNNQGPDNVTVEDNDVRDVTGVGILIIDGDDVVVRDNDVTDVGINNDGNGIEVEAGDGPVVKGNNVTNVGKNGILVDQAPNAEIGGNDITGADKHGIFLNQGTDPTFTDNYVNGTGNDGIRVDQGGRATFDGTEVRNASIEGIHFLGSSNVNATGTTLRDNGNWDIYADSSSNNVTFNDVDLGFENANRLDLNVSYAKVKRTSEGNRPDPREAKTDIGIFFNASETTGGAILNVTLEYAQSVESRVEEPTMSFQEYHTGSDDTDWVNRSSTLDTGTNTLEADIGNLSDNERLYAPLADPNRTVTDCQVISVSGVYQLDNDINAPSESGACIEITASNVIFEGNHYTITGGNKSGSKGFLVGASDQLSNVTIRNVTVSTWRDGIRFDGSAAPAVDGGNVTNVTVVDSGRDGIDIYTSRDITVEGTEVSNSRRDGIRINNKGSNVIRNTSVTGSGTYGVAVYQSDDNELRNVTVESGSVGVRIYDNGADRNEVHNSTVRGTDDGIHVNGADGTAVRNSTVENADVGINLTENAENNVFNDTSVTGYADWAVVDDSSGADNRFNRTDVGLANGNLTFTPDGVKVKKADRTPAPPDDQNDIDLYINATNITDSASLDLTVNYDPGAASDVSESRLTIWRNATEWSELGGTADPDRNQVTNEGIQDFGVLAPLAERVVTECGVIDESGGYLLDSNIVNESTEVCIEITADDVTLDGQGNLINGTNGTENSVGILVSNGSSNVNVENVTLDGWETAVGVGDGGSPTGVTVENVTVLADRTAGSRVTAGIAATGGSDLTVGNSTVYKVDRGIDVDGTGSVTLENNTVENAEVGVRLAGADSTYRVNGTTVEVVTEGIRVVDSGSLTFENTTVRDASDWAVNATRSSNVEFTNPDLDLSNGTASFTLTNVKVVKADAAAVADPPGTEGDIDLFLNATTADGSSPTLDLTVNYDLSGRPDLIENSTAIWRNDGETTGDWTELDSDLDPANDTVSRTITSIDPSGSTVGPLAANRSIDECGVIDDPGEYDLVDHISNSEADVCIEITASDVRLNGGGYEVNGTNGTDGSIGVWVNAAAVENVTVHDLTLAGWETGLEAGTTGGSLTGATLKNVDVVHPNTTDTSTGIEVVDASNVTVRNAMVSNFTRGIVLDNASDSTVVGSDVEDSGSVGVELTSSQGTLVRGTTTVDGAGDGIVVTDSANAKLVDDRALNNSDDGIEVSGTGSGVNLTNNTVENNTHGVALRSVSGVTAENTRAWNNTVGIRLDGAANNRFANATVRNNSEWAVAATPDGSGTAAKGNEFVTPDLALPNGTVTFTATDVNVTKANASLVADPPGTEGDIDLFLNATATSASPSLDLTVEYDLSGRDDLVEQSVAIWRNDDGTPDTWNELDSDLNTSNDTVSREITTFDAGGSTFGPLASNRSIDDCGVIDDPGEYELVDDITDDDAETCIEITSSNVSLHGGYHLVDGVNGTTDSRGIWVNGSNQENVTVENVFVEGWATGLQVGVDSGTSFVNGTVANVRAVDPNTTDSEGVVLVGVDDVTVTNATVVNATRGIVVDDSPDSTVEASSVRNASDVGIDVSGSGGTNVTEAFVNDSGTGIRLASSSSSRLTDNEVVNNSNDGIHVESSTGVTVERNDAVNNSDDGIEIASSGSASLRKNTALDNSGAGVNLTANSDDADLVDTVARNNTDGVRVDGSTDLFAENVTVTDNADGVRLAGAPSNSFANTTFRDNSDWAIHATTRGGQQSSNNEFASPDLDLPNGNASFTLTDVKLAKANASQVADSPGTEGDIDLFLNATDTSGAATLDLTVEYDLSGRDDLVEQSVAIWRNDEGTTANWTDLGGDLDTDNDTVTKVLTTFDDVSTFGPLAANRSIDDCGVIDDPGEYELVDDVTDADTDVCIEITASNVTFDGGNYELNGTNGTAGSIGVWVNASNDRNVTVTDLTVAGWETGMQVGSADGTLTNATVADVRAVASNGSTVSEGINVTGAENATVRDATVRNQTRGIVFDDSTESTVRKATVENVTLGVRLAGSSDHVVSNVTVRNATDAVQLVDSADNLFRNTTVREVTDWVVDASSNSARGGNNTFRSPDLDLPNGTVAFEVGDAKVTTANASRVAEAPGLEDDIDLFLNATGSGYLNLTVNYDIDGEPTLIEDSVQLWRNDNGTTEGWTDLPSDLDTGDDTVSENVTDLSGPVRTVGPLATNRSIDSCGEITAPGEYEVVADVTDAEAPACLEVTASNVSVDGGYHVFDGVNGTPGSRGVWVHDSSGLSNVTVTALTTTGWETGVTFNDTTENGTLEDVLVPDDNATVATGIELGDGTNVTVRNATVDNATTGIVLDGVTEGAVVDSAVNGSGTGVALRGGSNNSLVRTNVTNASGAGVSLAGSDDNVVDNTTVANTSDGVRLSSSSDTLFANVTIHASADWAVVAESGSTNATFDHPRLGLPNGTANFTLSNVKLRTVDQDDAPQTPITQDGIGMFLNATNTTSEGQFNLTVSYEQSVEGDIVEDTLAIWRYDEAADDWTELDSALDTGDNTVSRNISGFSVFAPLATNRTITECGVIDKEGPWDIGTDIVNDSVDPCIRITASNATLDGQGHVISGNRSDSTLAGRTGILVNDSDQVTNVTVENVVLTSWSEGIRFGGTESTGVDVDGVTVRNVNATASGLPDVGEGLETGVRIVDSKNATLQDVTVGGNASLVVTDGIALEGVTNATVAGGDVSAAETGISVRAGSDRVDVENNRVSNATVAGVRVTGSSTAVVVDDNDVTHSADGIVLATTATATNNTLLFNDAGIVLDSDSNTVRDNVYENNTEGLAVQGRFNDVENDTFRNNTKGVRLSASDNEFRNLTVRNSTDWSVVTDDTVPSLVGNNTFVTADFDFQYGTVTFTAGDVNVNRTADGDRPSIDSIPEAKKDVDVYLNVTRVSSAGYLNLSVDYVRRSPPEIEDETLAAWRHDGTWDNRSGDVNETTQVMRKNLTAAANDFGGGGSVVIAALADPAAPDFRVRINATNSPVNETKTLQVRVDVTNTGDLGGTQTIALSHNETAGTTEEETRTLDPDESATLNLTWDTNRGDFGDYVANVTTENDSATRNVTILRLPNFTVTDVESDSPVIEGETLTVNATVENVGDSPQTQTVNMTIDGEPNGSDTVSLDPGESRDIEFTWDPTDGDDGNYTATIHSANDSGDTNVRVLDAPDFQVTINETNDPVVETNNFTVEAVINNTGEVNDTQTIEMVIEDNVSNNVVETVSKTVSVNGGAEKTIHLNWSTVRGDDGNYTANVSSENDREDAGVQVLRAPNFTVTVVNVTTPVIEGENVTATADIENTGEVNDTQTVELEVSDGIGPQDEHVDLTLGPNEEQRINLTWETDRGQDGNYTLTVTSANDSDDGDVWVKDDTNFQVSIDGTNSPVVEGETMDVDVTVTNTGEVPGEQTVELTIPGGGTVRDARTVQLDPSEQASFTLNWSTDPTDGDTYVAEVASANDSAQEEVTVQTPASFQIAEVDTNAPVLESETMEFVLLVQNQGDLPDTQRVNFTVNGSVVDSTTLTLDGGGQSLVTLTWDTETGDAGEYIATFDTDNDSRQRNVSVLAPGAFTVDVESTTSPVVEGEPLNVTVTVTNTGDTQDSQTLSVEVGGDVVDFTEVSLAGGESEVYELTWQTEGGDAGNYQANVTTENDTARTDVRVDSPSAFTATVEDTNAPILEGETLRVNATVENIGDVEGTETVALVVDGEERASRNLTLGGGENETITLSWTTEEGDGGKYDAEVRSGPNGDNTTVTIQRPAELAVQIQEVESPVVEGEEMAVVASIENVGDIPVSRTVVLSVGGQERYTQDLTFSGGEERTIRLPWETGEGDAGNYTATVSIGGQSASEEVRVLAPATFEVSVDTVSSSVDLGQNVSTTVIVENVGDLAGNKTVTLSVGDAVRSEETVSLDPGGEERIVLTWATTDSDEGQYAALVESPDDSEAFDVSVGQSGNNGTRPPKPNELPTVTIGYGPESPGPGQTVDFRANAEDPDGTIEAYQWRIDGEPVSRSGSFSTTFEQSGTYTVKVVVTDNRGDNAEAKTVVVVNEAPTAEITDAPDTVREGQTVTFAGTGSDPDGDVVSYTWKVDGEVVGSSQNLEYTFQEGGTHQVTLEVTDDAGETTATTVSVEVTGNVPPSVDISGPTQVETGETAEFSALATDSDGQVTDYRWFVDDTIVSDAESIELTFEEPGKQEVRVVVSDADGAEAEATVTVFVNEPPEVDIETNVSNETVGVNESISFDVDPQEDLGENVTYEWRVDGEVVDTGETFDYTFEDDGSYDVTLVATDENGSTATETREILVEGQQQTESGSGDELDIAGAQDAIVPILVVLGFLTLLGVYIYVRFRQVTGGGESDSGN